MTDDKHRRQWMAMLAKMTSPMDAERATKALCDMLPMMTKLEDGYFSAQSLAFIAGRCKRVPSFGELKGHFGAWWQENLPAQARVESEYPRLEAPAERRAPTEDEKAIASDLVRNLKAELSAKRSARAPDEKQRPTPLPVSDQHLLTQYERTANDLRLDRRQRDAAAFRAGMIRRKLGVEEMAYAAE